MVGGVVTGGKLEKEDMTGLRCHSVNSFLCYGENRALPSLSGYEHLCKQL